MKSDRSKAAKKAARTRAANKFAMKYYLEVTEPGKNRLNEIFRELLSARSGKLRVRWNPTRDTGHKLKHGVTEGTLVGFRGGFFLRVLPDGYKQPKIWHPAFWELIR